MDDLLHHRPSHVAPIGGLNPKVFSHANGCTPLSPFPILLSQQWQTATMATYKRQMPGTPALTTVTALPLQIGGLVKTLEFCPNSANFALRQGTYREPGEFHRNSSGQSRLAPSRAKPQAELRANHGCD